MSTKNRIFSPKFRLSEANGKYGVIDGEGNAVLYPVYDSVCELDSFDFIIEQDGKFGYASYNQKTKLNCFYPCMML